MWWPRRFSACASQPRSAKYAGEAGPQPRAGENAVDQEEWRFAAAPLRLVGLDVDALGLDEDLVTLDGLDHGRSTLQ